MATFVAQKILDHIDRGNLAAAEVGLDGALRRYPADEGVLAAEALLLFRKGVKNEAKEKVLALAAMQPTQQLALSALTHTLQQMALYDELIKVYQCMLANKRAPDDEAATENLFTAFVRNNDFAGAARTGMQLQKSWPKRQYQMWIAMAQIAQVPAGDKDNLLLKLASRMLQTLTKEHGFDLNSSNMMLQLQMRQGLLDDATAFALGPNGAKLGVAAQRLEALYRCYMANDNKVAANAIATKLWKNNSDTWNHFEAVLKTLPLPADAASTFTLKLDGETEEELAVTKDVKAVMALAVELQKVERTERAGKMHRGPFMAELELAHTYPETASGGVATRIVEYCKTFGTKPVCFLDVVKYLTAEAAEAVEKWATEEGSAKDITETRKHTLRMLALRCIVCSKDHTDEEAMKIIEECRASYNDTKPLSKELEWSEEGITDGYLSIGANVALRRFAGTKDVKWVHVALWSCAINVERRLNNPGLLILETLLLTHIGLVDHEALNQLDFKSVQCDSMGHVGFFPLLDAKAMELIEGHCELSHRYYNGLQREMALLRAKVFKYNTISKLGEIAKYEHSMKHSIARLECIVHNAAVTMRYCQTQKDRQLELNGLRDDLIVVLQAKEDETIRGEDDVVVGSTVIGAIGSDAHSTVQHALQNPAPLQVSARFPKVQAQAAQLAIIHDVSLITERKESKASMASASRGKKGKKHADPVPDSTASKFRFITVEFKDSLEARLAAFPAPLVAVYKPLLACVQAVAENTSDAKAAAAVTSAIQAPEFYGLSKELLHPHAVVLAHILAAADGKLFPVSTWAKELNVLFKKLKEDVVEVPAAIKQDALPDGVEGLCEYYEKIFKHTAQQQVGLLADLITECTAAERKR